jgi:hypothetical protein
MCLHSPTTPEPLVAEEDIHCYKVLWVEKDRLYAPYQNHYWYRLGELNKIDGWHYQFDNPERAIVSQGFHTFQQSKPSFDLIETVSKKNRHRYKAFDCIIPKGAKYFKGEWDNGTPCYVSDQLIVDGESSIWLAIY